MRSAILLASLVVCGCTGASTGQVGGKVTYQGLPANGAEMQFISTTDPDHVFFGMSAADGEFQVSYRTFDGLPVGRYKVLITIYTLPSGVPFPPGEKADTLKTEGKLVQNTYEFERDIHPGQNTMDFEITQGQKQES